MESVRTGDFQLMLDTRQDGWVLQAGKNRVGTTVVHPRGQDGMKIGAAREIGIGVEGDFDALTRGGIENRKQFVSTVAIDWEAKMAMGIGW